MVVFKVLGNPIAKKRPRFAVRNGQGRAYNSQQTEEGLLLWEVRNQYKGAPLDGPLHVTFRFYFTPPKSASKKLRADMLAQRVMHTKKPDCSNLNKFYEDVMNGYVWIDDCQIITTTVEKYYGETDRTEIYVIPYTRTEQTEELFNSVRKQIMDSQGAKMPDAAVGACAPACSEKRNNLVTVEDF